MVFARRWSCAASPQVVEFFNSLLMIARCFVHVLALLRAFQTVEAETFACWATSRRVTRPLCLLLAMIKP